MRRIRILKHVNSNDVLKAGKIEHAHTLNNCFPLCVMHSDGATNRQNSLFFSLNRKTRIESLSLKRFLKPLFLSLTFIHSV